MWRRVCWLWLCGLLASCASTPASPSEREAAEYPEAYTRLAEGACVTFHCVEEACGLFRCEDVEPEFGRVVRTRGAYVIPPSAVRSPQRNWAYPWQLPGRPEPVFVIRWYGRGLLPSQKKMLEAAKALASKPREKHHIFPRQEGLREWFERQGINIHQETMLLDLDTHHRIHKGPVGGPLEPGVVGLPGGESESNEGGHVSVRAGTHHPLRPVWAHPALPSVARPSH